MKIKQKTHSGAKARFKISATGKIKRRSAFSSHLLGGKSQDRKRGYRKDIDISQGDMKNIRKMLSK